MVDSDGTWVVSGNTLLPAKDIPLLMLSHQSSTPDLMGLVAGIEKHEVMEHGQLEWVNLR